jgi:hypothetical protein
MRMSLLKWELWGIAFIFFLGSALHFFFAATGSWPPVGAIAAVNESVWEHLKLTFWPALAWALLEYRFLKESKRNFWWAKALGIYAMPITISIVFYTYTAATGHSILAMDITTFALAAAVGQLLSYKILTSKDMPVWLNYFGIALIAVLGSAYVIFTYVPPHLHIFLDKGAARYGIPK